MLAKDSFRHVDAVNALELPPYNLIERPAYIVCELKEDHYNRCGKIVLAADNLNIRSIASLYKSFEPAAARWLTPEIVHEFIDKAAQKAQEKDRVAVAAQSKQIEISLQAVRRAALLYEAPPFGRLFPQTEGTID